MLDGLLEFLPIRLAEDVVPLSRPEPRREVMGGLVRVNPRRLLALALIDRHELRHPQLLDDLRRDLVEGDARPGVRTLSGRRLDLEEVGLPGRDRKGLPLVVPGEGPGAIPGFLVVASGVARLVVIPVVIAHSTGHSPGRGESAGRSVPQRAGPDVLREPGRVGCLGLLSADPGPQVIHYHELPGRRGRETRRISAPSSLQRCRVGRVKRGPPAVPASARVGPRVTRPTLQLVSATPRYGEGCRLVG